MCFLRFFGNKDYLNEKTTKPYNSKKSQQQLKKAKARQEKQKQEKVAIL